VDGTAWADVAETVAAIVAVSARAVLPVRKRRVKEFKMSCLPGGWREPG
jgi:hypothetical protein